MSEPDDFFGNHRGIFKMRIFMTMLFAGAILMGSAHAMGHGGGGKGRTKIDFQFDTVDSTKSRLFAKIDVSALLSQLGNSGNKSHNDDLAGYTLTLTFAGSSTFSVVMDSKGKTKEDGSTTPPSPFTAKLTANGKILQVMATGLNLQTLLGVNTAQTEGQFAIEIDVSASKTDSTVVPPVTTTIPLSTQNVTFNYSVKNTTVKGRNF